MNTIVVTQHWAFVCVAKTCVYTMHFGQYIHCPLPSSRHLAGMVCRHSVADWSDYELDENRDSCENPRFLSL
jgi:hypothetical protein